MLRLRSQFIVYSLQFITACAATATGVDLSAREPIDYFDSAELISNGNGTVLQNLHHDDSRYVVPLSFEVSGHILVVTAEVIISASNSVWISLGDEIDPEGGLRIGCVRGKWIILAGDQIRGFSDPLPAPVAGTDTYTLRLVTDTSKNSFPSTVTVSPNSAGYSAPPPSAWLSATPPETWTQATLSLRGAGAGIRSLKCDMVSPPTIIIIR